MWLMVYQIAFVKPAKQKQHVLNYRNINWKYEGDEFIGETKDFWNDEKTVSFYWSFNVYILFLFLFLFGICV